MRVSSKLKRTLDEFDMLLTHKINDMPIERALAANPLRPKEEKELDVNVLKKMRDDFHINVQRELDAEYCFKRNDFQNAALAVIFSNIPIAELIQMKPLLSVNASFTEDTLFMIGDQTKILDLFQRYGVTKCEYNKLEAEVRVLRKQEIVMRGAFSATLFQPVLMRSNSAPRALNESDLSLHNSKNPR